MLNQSANGIQPVCVCGLHFAGILECDYPAFSASVFEDTPTLIFLIGRTVVGLDRTTAVISQVPRVGTLYQLTKCCDVTGMGAVIQDGDTVLDGSSAVIYVPPSHGFGTALANLSVFVRDTSGAASALATLVIDVNPVEDAPEMAPSSEGLTPPLTPVFVPLAASDAEGDVVTLTVARLPANGKIFLTADTVRGAKMSELGTSLSMSVIQQHAVDVLNVSSFYVSGTSSWHPLQATGERGETAHVPGHDLTPDALPCTLPLAQMSSRHVPGHDLTPDALPCTLPLAQMSLCTATVCSHGRRGCAAVRVEVPRSQGAILCR